jgi:hypothetical protein
MGEDGIRMIQQDASHVRGKVIWVVACLDVFVGEFVKLAVSGAKFFADGG